MELVAVRSFVKAQDTFNHGPCFGSALHTPRIRPIGTCTSHRVILLWQGFGCRSSQSKCFEFLVQHQLSQGLQRYAIYRSQVQAEEWNSDLLHRIQWPNERLCELFSRLVPLNLASPSSEPTPSRAKSSTNQPTPVSPSSSLNAPTPPESASTTASTSSHPASPSQSHPTPNSPPRSSQKTSATA